MSGFSGRGRGQLGFTLIEVVIALAILSLVMLATVSALRTFANTQTSLDTLVDRVDEVRAVSSFLRAAFEGAEPGAQGGGLGLGGRSGTQALFRGDAQWVEWQAPVLFGESFGGRLLLRLGLENQQMVLRWQEPPASASAEIVWTDSSSRVLVDNVTELSLMYRPEYGEDWQQNWDENGSPALLRLQLQAGQRFWPDLVMEVRR